MGDANPFDLGRGGRGGPEKPVAAKTWTPAEQAEKLKGYLEAPRDCWEQIRYGTHLRYYTKDNQFRSGGFVLKNPYVLTSGDTKKNMFHLQNGFNPRAPGYQQWYAAYEDTTRVFIKPDAGALVTLKALEQVVKDFNENFQEVGRQVKKLGARVATLEARISALESRR